MTTNCCRLYKLRIDVEDWDGNTAYAEYSSFRVTSEADKYRLLLGDYRGNASADASEDSLQGFLYHNNQQFTTYDQDNDAYSDNCIIHHNFEFGGFWYNSCTRVTPTNTYCPVSNCGLYYLHIRYQSWRMDIGTYSLKKIKLMMRPTTY